jgi:hypothetical protein
MPATSDLSPVALALDSACRLKATSRLRMSSSLCGVNGGNDFTNRGYLFF